MVSYVLIERNEMVADCIDQGKMFKCSVQFQIKGTPAYFTDYCCPAVEYTREQFEKAGKTRISEGQVNPFRSPVRVHSPESEIPRLSNGIVFHLMYSNHRTETESNQQTFETVSSLSWCILHCFYVNLLFFNKRSIVFATLESITLEHANWDILVMGWKPYPKVCF